MTTMRLTLRQLMLTLVAMLCLGLVAGQAQAAPTTEELNHDAERALHALYSTNSAAARVGKEAKAILVFPKITKAGLVFGGSYGEGVLFEGGKPTEYYNSVSASWGWQAGVESYGYVVFLMNDEALHYLKETKGWEIGVGPSIVVVDAGKAKNLSTSTLKDNAYAFIFDQKGLMASLSIEGTKISRINPRS